MKKLRLKETCTQYTVSRNRYGDLVLTTAGSILCLYRNISQLNRGINYREEISIEGIFWFDPAATIKQGDVVGYQSQLYRIEKLTVAKALLTSNQIHFLKCEVSLYRSVS